MKQSSKTISTWNAGDEFLKYQIQQMRDFDLAILRNLYEDAFFIMRNWIDDYSPYLRDQKIKIELEDSEDVINNHLEYCDFCIKTAEKLIFSELRKAQDNESKSKYATNRANALVEMRKAKRNLLYCMAKFNSLLPTQIKYDWLTESMM